MIIETESIEIGGIESTTVVIGKMIATIVNVVTSVLTIVFLKVISVITMGTARMTGATVQRKIQTMTLGGVLALVNIPVVVLQARGSTDGVNTRGAGVGTTE